MDALRLRYRATAKGGTYDYVRSRQVPPGQIWHIRNHSFENETGTRGEARAFVEGHGYNHWLWEEEVVTLATLYWSEEELVLTEGERLAVRQASCTIGDKLQLLVNGVREENPRQESDKETTVVASTPSTQPSKLLTRYSGL